MKRILVLLSVVLAGCEARTIEVELQDGRCVLAQIAPKGGLVVVWREVGRAEHCPHAQP